MHDSAVPIKLLSPSEKFDFQQILLNADTTVKFIFNITKKLVLFIWMWLHVGPTFCLSLCNQHEKLNRIF